MANFNTGDYRTRTIIEARKNPGGNLKSWGVAVDIGYSSVKMFSPNSIACFPAYAKRVPIGTGDGALGQIGKNVIIYRDSTSEYFVGQMALDDASTTDASAASHFVRDRYNKDDFKVLARTGIALGCMKNQCGDPGKKPVCITTGLPPAYLEEDSGDITAVFAGTHVFSVKVGNSDWQDFKITIVDTDVSVISQPLGTLFSISMDTNGGMVADAKKYFASNLIVFDPGYGTLDLFTIKNAFPDPSKCVSRDDLGMKAVFERTSQLIEKKYGVKKSVHELTMAMPKGEIIVGDRKRHIQKSVPFGEELEQASNEICKEALSFLDSETNYLNNVDYLVITGGTGAAWYKMIAKELSQSQINIVKGNVTDPSLDGLFGNVRGYYMSMLTMIKRG